MPTGQSCVDNSKRGITSKDVENAQTRIDSSLPLLEAGSSCRWDPITEIGLFTVVGSRQLLQATTCPLGKSMRSTRLGLSMK